MLYFMTYESTAIFDDKNVVSMIGNIRSESMIERLHISTVIGILRVPVFIWTFVILIMSENCLKNNDVGIK